MCVRESDCVLVLSAAVHSVSPLFLSYPLWLRFATRLLSCSELRTPTTPLKCLTKEPQQILASSKLSQILTHTHTVIQINTRSEQMRESPTPTVYTHAHACTHTYILLRFVQITAVQFVLDCLQQCSTAAVLFHPQTYSKMNLICVFQKLFLFS